MLFTKNIFNHISSTVAALVDTASNPLVRFVDFDLGQLDEEKPPVSFPCVLVNFTDTDNFFTYKDFAQNGEQQIELKIAFKRYERTHSVNTPTFRDEALKMLDTVEAIHTALQGTEGDCFGKLNRQSVRQEQRADLRVFLLIYTCSVQSDAPSVQYVPISTVPAWIAGGSIPVAPDITVEVKPG